MKKNAKQIDRAKGQRAALRSTAPHGASQVSIDPFHSQQERRLRLIEVRAVLACASFLI
jgi:hypothetical protein